VAEELKVNPRTARRLLNRMTLDGWLVRREGPRPTYTPTLRIVALAAELAQRAPLVRHGHEVADQLHVATGEAAHLAIPSYRSALRLVRATGDAPAVRDLAPAHAVAAGKLLLAFRDGWRDAVLGGPLPAVTERTLVRPAALLEDLGATRERGYALEDGEFHPGCRALAVPVRGRAGEVVAALALSATGAAPVTHARLVAAAGEELSARLARAA
jgi:DNA-binding IclR family transcriptional regulator